MFDHIIDCLFEDAFDMDAFAMNFVGDFRLELMHIFQWKYYRIIYPNLDSPGSAAAAGSEVKFEEASNNWKTFCEYAKYVFVYYALSLSSCIS